MGTNVYLRRKVPRMVPEYDEVHVAKMSGGWRVHFDGSSMDEWREPDDPRQRVGSMADLRGYLDTGDWELVDEYGYVRTLEDVLSHDEYRRDGELLNTRVSMDDYYDRESYPWSRREFC